MCSKSDDDVNDNADGYSGITEFCKHEYIEKTPQCRTASPPREQPVDALPPNFWQQQQNNYFEENMPAQITPSSIPCQPHDSNPKTIQKIRWPTSVEPRAYEYQKYCI